MLVAPSQAIAIDFRVEDSSGVLADADSTPAGVLYRNGAATAIVVTVASITGTGKYSAAWTMGAYASGDQVSLEVTATVDGTAYAAKVWEASLGNAPTAEENALAAREELAPELALIAAIDGNLTTARLTKIDNLPSAWPTNLNLLSIDGSGRITLNTTQMTELLSDDDIGAIATAIIESFNESSDVPIITQATAMVDRLKADAMFLGLVADALAAKNAAEANSTEIAKVPKQNENRTWTIGGSDPSVIRIGAAE